MKIYISGPISGHDDLNLPAFRAASADLWIRGQDPVVPHDIAPWQHDGDCPPSYTHGIDHTAACYLRGDVAVLVTCDALLMLEGWEASVGARLEHSVAAHCGLRIFYSLYGVPEIGGRRVGH